MQPINYTAKSLLTEENLHQINSGLDVVEHGLRHAEMAERAGIDVTDAKKRLTDSQAKLRQIKNTYFPGR